MSRKNDYIQTLLTQIGCLVFGVFSSVLTARWLLPEGCGRMTILEYYPTLMGTFLPLATPQAITLFMASRPERADAYARAGMQLALIMAIGGAFLFCLGAPRLLSLQDRSLAGAVAIACMAAPSMVMMPSIQAVYRADQQFKWVNKMLLLAAASYVVLLGALWLTGHLTPLNAVLAGFVGQYLICGLGVAGMWGRWRSAHIEPGIYRDILLQGIRFFMPAIAMALYELSDRAILMKTTDLKQLGYYTVAFSATFPLTLISEPFLQIGFVELAFQDDLKGKQALFLRRFKVSQIVLLFAFLGMAAVLYPFIRVLQGPAFLDAIFPAYICLVAMFVKSLSRFWENSMRTVNLNWPSILANVLAVALLAVLGYILVPSYGIAGFAAALIIVEFSKFVFMVLFSRNILYEGSLGTLFFEKKDMVLAAAQVKQLATSLRGAVQPFW